MEFFGLDIGSYKIKAAQVKKRGDQYQLLAFGSAPSLAKGLFSEAESDLNALAEVIKKLYQETKIQTKNVVVALPQDRVFTRVIDLPKLSEEELSSALKWEAEQYIPFPLEEVVLAHQIIGKSTSNGKDEVSVLLVAAPRNLIEKMTKVLKAAGLNPISLEMEMMALARSLVAIDAKSVFLAEVGAGATDFAIVENGQVVFANSIPVAGKALTQVLAQKLNLESEQAEAYKKAYGVDPAQVEGRVSEAMSPVLGTIIAEMEKIIQYHQTNTRGENNERKIITRVVLTGGTSILPEMAAVLAKKLNLEIQIGDPFGFVIKDKLVGQIAAEDSHYYAVALGLAMKKID